MPTIYHRFKLMCFILLVVLQAFNSCKRESGKDEANSKSDREQSQPAETASQKDSSGRCRDKSISSEVSTEGMVFFEGGNFVMGNDQGKPDQQPAHKTEVGAYYIDKHPVTVGQFSKFIEATGYTTDAEAFGNSGIFLFNQGRWNLLKGATWEFPQGPGQSRAEDDHPVTHVSWKDAQEYCRWAGKRLPTEKEWEYAARNEIGRAHV